MQRPQVFLHLFFCASLLQKLGSGAFNSHHHEPKPGIVLSSHEVEHLNLDSHDFLHVFLSFLHFFFPARGRALPLCVDEASTTDVRRAGRHNSMEA